MGNCIFPNRIHWKDSKATKQSEACSTENVGSNSSRDCEQARNPQHAARIPRPVTRPTSASNNRDSSALPITASGPSVLMKSTSPKTPSKQTPQQLIDARRTSMDYSMTNRSQPLTLASQRAHSSSSTAEWLSPAPVTEPHKKGRALCHRLEKARSRQSLKELSPSSSIRTNGSDTSLGSNEPVNYDSDASDQILLPQKYTDTEPTTRSQNQMLREKANRQSDQAQGTIWANIETDDGVTCLAMSRTKPTLSRPNPVQLVAGGTSCGTMTVTELLDDSQVSLADSFDQMHSSHRIGRSHSISRKGRVRCIDFSPDGCFCAVGGDDSVCTVIRLLFNDDGSALTGLEFWEEFERVDRVYAVQYSPNGEFLAIGGFDGTVSVIRVSSTGKSLDHGVEAELPSGGLVYTIEWDPRGRFLAFAGSDKTCCIVDTSDAWSIVHEIRLQASIQSLSWSPTNGQYLAIASTAVVIVDSDSFAVREEINLAPKKHRKRKGSTTGHYKVNALCWSPNGSYLVVGASNNLCTLVETKTFTVVHELARPASVSSVVWGQQSAIGSLPRRYLAIAGEDKNIVIMKAGVEPRSQAPSDLSSSFSSLASLRDDWENQVLDIDSDFLTTPKETESLTLSKSNVVAVAFSRGSKKRKSVFLAYSLDDGSVVVRSTSDWNIANVLRFTGSPIRALSFSNGSRFLAYGNDSAVYVSKTSSSWELIAETTVAFPVRTLSFSKNNERLAVATVYGRLNILDCENNYRSLGEVKDSHSTVLAVDWSSKYMAAGRKDGTVGIYSCPQVFSGRYRTVAGFQRTGAVNAVSFGANSRFLAVGGEDGFSIYSQEGGWIPCHHLPFGESIATLRWNATGRYVALAGEHGLFKVIDTIFWNEVTEIDSLVPGKSRHLADGVRAMPSVSFGQDGAMIAYSHLREGLRVLSCAQWEIVFGAGSDHTSSI